MDAAKRESDGAPVALLAHSAGGWLARTYLLGCDAVGIDALVTLGSPHLPPPPDSGAPDQTRGILTWVEAECPGTHHSTVAYTSVAGKFIKGARLGDGGAPWSARLAGAGYASVCGSADVWGDAIVPLPSAHLPGAVQVTLEGVYHSPLGASEEREEAGGEGEAQGGEDGEEGAAPPKRRRWYGSPAVVDQWVGALALDGVRAGAA